MRLPLVITACFAAISYTASLTPASAIDTIDCRRDHNAAERTICSSQALQTLDARITEQYADIMLDSHIKGSVKRAVHESQVEFLARRDSCGRDTECLTEVMGRRASRINFYR
jgi:uncharacterized protein